MKLFIQNYTMDNFESSKSYSQEFIYSPVGVFLFKQRNGVNKRSSKKNITR